MKSNETKFDIYYSVGIVKPGEEYDQLLHTLVAKNANAYRVIEAMTIFKNLYADCRFFDGDMSILYSEKPAEDGRTIEFMLTSQKATG